MIGLVALVVRIAAASLVPFPIPEDTAYYYGVARNLVEGRGLVSDAVWTFQTPPLIAPRAGVRGLAAAARRLLAAIPMAVLRDRASGRPRSCRSSPAASSRSSRGGWRWDVAVERGLPRAGRACSRSARG